MPLATILLATILAYLLLFISKFLLAQRYLPKLISQTIFFVGIRPWRELITFTSTLRKSRYCGTLLVTQRDGPGMGLKESDRRKEMDVQLRIEGVGVKYTNPL